MKLLSFDQKRGEVKMVVENLDDLWHLYNLVEKGDIAYARTTREIKADADAARPSQGRRVGLVLGLRVEEVFFDRNTNRLRIRGTITEGPERYDGLLGSHHTFSISVGGILKLVKEAWPSHHLRRLREAEEVKASPAIIVALDDEDACVAVLGRFNFDVKFEKRVRLPGKLELERRSGELLRYFSEVAQALTQTHTHIQAPIVVVGPGYIKNEFVNYLKANYPRVATDIAYVCSVGSAGSAGIGEALRGGALTKVLARCRMLEEINLIENFLAQLAGREGKTAYGLDDVEAATGYGAVETLIVVDRCLRELPDEERRRLERLMREVERMGGRVIVVSGQHEGGEKIYSLSGVAALLRYAVK